MFTALNLADLRIAAIGGVEGSPVTWGGHRLRVADDCGEFDDTSMFDSLELLRKGSYLRLIKWDEPLGWRDYMGYSNVWEFVNGNGFRMILTSEGRQLLQELEVQLHSELPVKHNEIGFRASG